MEKFNPKEFVNVSKKSKVGALIYVDSYGQFKELIEKAENKADMFAEVEKVIAQNIETGRDIKSVTDAAMKPFNKAHLDLRSYLTKYMEENSIDKIEGVKSKSITLQKEKVETTKTDVLKMKIGGKWIDANEITRENFVNELVRLGAKTKIVSVKETVTKQANIRVIK